MPASSSTMRLAYVLITEIAPVTDTATFKTGVRRTAVKIRYIRIHAYMHAHTFIPIQLYDPVCRLWFEF